MDIALEFASWISPEFKLYIIKDYKRLKSDESSHLSLNWNLNREIARLNYLKNAGRRKEFKEMLVQDFCTSCIFRYAPVVYRLQFQW